MNAAFENRDYFTCKITNDLITEYNVFIDGASTLSKYNGAYWEAAVYFDNVNFTLNAFAQTGNEVKEIEVLKFPRNKIIQIQMFETEFESAQSHFKIASMIASAFTLLIFLVMFLNPEPGYTDIGFMIFTSLFLGIGLGVVYLAKSFLFNQTKKNICINLATNDKRLITLFADIEQKEWIMEILSRYYSEFNNKAFFRWEINQN
jgi:hypothetical protein